VRSQLKLSFIKRSISEEMPVDKIHGISQGDTCSYGDQRANQEF